MTSDTTSGPRNEPGRRAGQRVSLVSTLRRLIRDYPPGIGIVKEFLQNADDAGATWLRVTFDERHHRAERMPSQRMSHLMGPALLLSSDQVFSSEDLEKIQDIGDGSKAQDSQKTGQFGVGFNTSYAVTDYPAFATRDIIRCFDPIEDTVAVDGFPGREWGLADLWSQWPDWPAAFGIEQNCTDLDYTVFRLPLRSAQQAKPDRLSQLPFTSADVSRVFKEVVEFGTALLLFTASVLHLELRWISAGGDTRQVVSIRTANSDTVREHRSRIRLSKPTEVALNEWKDDPSSCPRVAYRHKFTVDTSGPQVEHFWFVAQGFELGSNGAVLRAAANMLSVGKKAVPRVGAAVALRASEGAFALAATAGYLFCALPLPDASGLPFHINGFFDLDTSRTDPTHGELAGDAAIRVDWNRALAEDAIPAIVAFLFASIPERVKEQDPAGAYSVWPDKDFWASRRAWVKEIGTGVVRCLALLPTIRVRGGTTSRWVRPGDARREPSGWIASLAEALRDDGFELTDPPLPSNMLDNLRRIDRAPNHCSRLDLGSWLARTVDCNITDAPLLCLRRPELVRLLLDFLADDSSSPLAGLPLGLRQDGTLKTLQDSEKFLVADDEIRTLFVRWPRWFAHRSIEPVFLRRNLWDGGVVLIKPQGVISLVRWVLGRSSGGAPVSWTTGLLGGTDTAWLESVALYLASHVPSDPVRAFQHVPFVPDQAGYLRPFYQPTTPAFLPDKISVLERSALDAFQVPLVHGPTSLKASIFALSRRLPGRPHPPLAEAIAVRLVEPPESEGAASRDMRTALLGLLARLHEDEPLPDDVLERLKDAPIWPIDNGELASARAADVYLPTGFSPPFFGQGVTLFEGESGLRCRSLLRALGAKEFSASEYVALLFSRLYAQLPSETQRAALQWVAGSALIDALSREASSESRHAIATLRNTALVRCTDGQLREGRRLHHPDDALARSLLGAQACVPDMDFYGEPRDSWLALFVQLQMARSPRPRDLLMRILELTAQAEQEGVASVESDIASLILHLGQRWSSLADERVGDTSLLEQLREIAWMPALGAQPGRVEFGLVRPTLDRLYLPRELFVRGCGYLVASQEPLAAVAEPGLDAMFSALGVRDTVPLSTAIRHFEAVISRSADSEDLEPNVIAKTALRFYRLAGAAAQGATTPLPQLATLRGRPCVWDVERLRFLKPVHCFAVRVPYFGSLRTHVAAEGHEAEGLNQLGRRATPSAPDFVSFLNDLAIHVGGRAVTSEERDSALYALRQLHALVETSQPVGDLVVLTTEDRLRLSSQVLIDDCPWWRERIRCGPVALLHESISPEIARQCKLRGAAEVLREVLICDPPEVGEASVAEACRRFEERVRAPAFEEGVRRLVYQEHQRNGRNLGVALAVRFVPSGPIRTALSNSPSNPNARFGEDDVDVFLDGARVFISSAEADVPLIAEAINRRLGVDRLRNLAPLEEILGLAPSDVERALTRRRVPAVPVAVPTEMPVWKEAGSGGPGLGSAQVRATSSHGEAEDAAAARPAGARLPNLVVPAGASSSASEGRPTPTTVGTISDEQSSGGDEAVGIDAAPRESDIGDTTGLDAPRGFNSDGPWRRQLQPSSAPGDGSAEEYVPRSGMRLRSYLSPPGAGREIMSPEAARLECEEVHAAAMDRVRRYESTRAGIGSIVEIAYALGCDIVTTNECGETERFITVKGLLGGWTSHGVGLDAQQLAFARSHSGRFWLYVVEHATDPVRARVLAVSNPVERATEFRFDGGWRKLAESDPLAITEPAVGLHLHKGDEYIGVVEAIESAHTVHGEAPLVRLSVRTPQDDSKRITFSPSKHTLTRGR